MNPAVVIRPAVAFPAQLAGAVEQARSYFDAADAPNTKRAYASGFRHFETWCATQGLIALPAGPDIVALYLAAHAGRQAVATLASRLAAIARRHRDTGHESPVGHQAVARVWRGIRREKGVAPAKKAPALTRDLQAMVNGLGESLIARRDRALLLLGYAGAFRRSELVALNRSDVEITRDGLVVKIRRSKTDQQGEGAAIGVPYGATPATCPVRAVQTWLQAAGIEHGPLFRPIGRGDGAQATRLSDRSVALVVKRRAQAAGLDAAKFAGHSLRAGMITQAAIAGVAEHAIGRQSRHKSVAVLRGYIRDADMFARNAAASLGL